jgi:hypothetical protein
LVGVHDITALLNELGAALSRQRQALESSLFDQLAAINSELESTFARMEQWPGGIAGFVGTLQDLPPPQRQAALVQLGHIRLDHRISGDLIRATSQRIAALQAFMLAGSAQATYAPGLSPVTGSQISRRA